MSEFKEPWTVIHLDDRCAEIYSSGGKALDGHSAPIPEAERIVACVNFCAGLPTDFILKHDLFPPTSVKRKLVAVLVHDCTYDAFRRSE